MKHAQRNTQAKGTRMEPILLKLFEATWKRMAKACEYYAGMDYFDNSLIRNNIDLI